MSNLVSLEELAGSNNDDLYINYVSGDNKSSDVTVPIEALEQQHFDARQQYLEKLNRITSQETGEEGNGSYNKWLKEVGIHDEDQIQNLARSRDGQDQSRQGLTLSNLTAELAEQQVDDLVMKLQQLEQQDLKFQEQKLKHELIQKNYTSPLKRSNDSFTTSNNNNGSSVSPKTYINMQHNKVFSSPAINQDGNHQQQYQQTTMKNQQQLDTGVHLQQRTRMNKIDQTEYIHNALYATHDKKRRDERDMLHTSFANLFLHSSTSANNDGTNNVASPPSTESSLPITNNNNSNNNDNNNNNNNTSSESPYYNGANDELKQILQAQRRKSSLTENLEAKPPPTATIVQNKSQYNSDDELMNTTGKVSGHESGVDPLFDLLKRAKGEMSVLKQYNDDDDEKGDKVVVDKETPHTSSGMEEWDNSLHGASSPEGLLPPPYSPPSLSNIDHRTETATHKTTTLNFSSPTPRIQIATSNLSNKSAKMQVPIGATELKTDGAVKESSMTVDEVQLSKSIVDDAITQLAKRANTFATKNNSSTTSTGVVLASVANENDDVLASLQATTYQIGTNYSNVPLPAESTTNKIVDEIIDVKTNVENEEENQDNVTQNETNMYGNNTQIQKQKNEEMAYDNEEKNDLKGLSLATGSPVGTWKRRMKIQELALKEAEDALQRAEGDIELAKELNHPKNEQGVINAIPNKKNVVDANDVTLSKGADIMKRAIPLDASKNKVVKSIEGYVINRDEDDSTETEEESNGNIKQYWNVSDRSSTDSSSANSSSTDSSSTDSSSTDSSSTDSSTSLSTDTDFENGYNEETSRSAKFTTQGKLKGKKSRKIKKKKKKNKRKKSKQKKKRKRKKRKMYHSRKYLRYLKEKRKLKKRQKKEKHVKEQEQLVKVEVSSDTTTATTNNAARNNDDAVTVNGNSTVAVNGSSTIEHINAQTEKVVANFTPMKSFDEFLQSNMYYNDDGNSSSSTVAPLNNIAASNVFQQQVNVGKTEEEDVNESPKPVQQQTHQGLQNPEILLSYKKQAIQLSNKYKEQRIAKDKKKAKQLNSIKLKAVQRHKEKQSRFRAVLTLQKWWKVKIMKSIRLLQQEKLKEKFSKQLKELKSSSSRHNMGNSEHARVDNGEKEGTLNKRAGVKINTSDVTHGMPLSKPQRKQNKSAKLNTSYEKLKGILQGYIVRLTLKKIPRSVTLIKTICDSNNLLKELAEDDPLFPSIKKQLISQKKEFYKHLENVNYNGIGAELRKVRNNREKMLIHTSQQGTSPRSRRDGDENANVAKRSSRVVKLGTQARERMKAYNLKLKEERNKNRNDVSIAGGNNHHAGSRKTDVTKTKILNNDNDIDNKEGGNTLSSEEWGNQNTSNNNDSAKLTSPIQSNDMELEQSSKLWLKEAFNTPPLLYIKPGAGNMLPNSFGVEIVSAQNLIVASHIYKDRAQNRNPYAILTLKRKNEPYLRRKTRHQKRTLDPTFNTMFLFKLNLQDDDDTATINDFVLDIELRDNDRFNKQSFLGIASIPLGSLIPTMEGNTDTLHDSSLMDEAVQKCDVTISLENKVSKDVVRGTVRARMKLMGLKPSRDVEGGLPSGNLSLSKRNNVRKNNTNKFATKKKDQLVRKHKKSEENILQSHENVDNNSSQVLSNDKATGQNDEKRRTMKKKKKIRNKISRKLDWSHVKSRTDCHLQRKASPTTSARSRYDTNFTGSKNSFPSDLPWNIINKSTGRSAYEQNHNNAPPLHIHTNLSSLLSPKNMDRVGKTSNKRTNKPFHQHTLDSFEDGPSVQNIFERYQRGPISPKYDRTSANQLVGHGAKLNAFKIEELSELLEYLSGRDRRLLEQDEEADVNSTIPRLDRREFFKVYDDRKYEVETNRLKQEYIELGGAGVSPSSPF